MAETEEERRLRREKKKRDAARKAAAAAAAAEGGASAAGSAPASAPAPPAPSKAAPTAAATPAKSAPTAAPPAGDDAAAAAGGARKETEEERRIRKEKKRAQREAQKQQEAAAAAAAGGAAPPIPTAAPTTAPVIAVPVTPVTAEEGATRPKLSKEERRAAREKEKEKERRRSESDAAARAVGRGGTPGETPVRDASPPLPDANAALLQAIAAENNAVVAQSVRNSRNFAAAELKRETEAKERKRLESVEERAELKRAEREARRRQRDSAAAGGTADGEHNTNNGAGADGASTLASVGASPVTAFDPSELQRQAYRAQFQKDLARATALRRLVDFDSSGGVVLDLAPQSAYDLYIRDFGQSGREQVGVQAPPEEERLDTGTQAERGRLRARGAQAPEDLGLCPEEAAERQFFQLRRNAMLRNGKDAGAAVGGAGAGNDADGADGEDGGEGGGGGGGKSAGPGGKKKARAVDAAMLERFLTNALPVMSAVLDENNATASGAAAAAAAASVDSAKPKASTPFSSTYTTFCWRGTRNRPVVQVVLNPANPRQLVALHGAVDETGPSPALDTFLSVLLLWNIHDAATPERVLVSCAPVTCVCVSPTRPHLIYGGTADGNVCVWSLREPDRMHLAAGRYERVVFHLPSYNTGWQVGGHGAAVRQVRVAGYNSVAAAAARKEEAYEQLVSMDETGAMCYWALTEKREAAETGGATAAAAAGHSLHDSDYGLHPGSGVSLHLAKGSTLAGAANAVNGVNGVGVSGAAAGGGGGAAGGGLNGHGGGGGGLDDVDGALGYSAGVTGGFDFSPSDGSQYVMTAPHGVVRRSRFGGIAAPSLYGPSNSGSRLPYAIAAREDRNGVKVLAVPCCVQYNALDTRWFVVGYEDGTVRLYLQHEATPQVTVEVGYQPIIALRCSGMTPWVVWALDESGEVHMIDFAYHRRQEPRFSHALTQPDTGVCTCMDLSSKDEKADQRFLVVGFEKGMVQVHTVDVERLRMANSERDEKWI